MNLLDNRFKIVGNLFFIITAIATAILWFVYLFNNPFVAPLGNVTVQDVWWNASDYDFRVSIVKNTTRYSSLIINDTSGVKVEFIHAYVGNSSYLYSTASGLSGDVVVANETAVNAFFISTNCSGRNATLVYSGAEEVLTFDANNGTTCLDCSGASRTGVCRDGSSAYGSAVECNWTDGVFGYGIENDNRSGSYVVLPIFNTVENESFTVEVWAYPTGISNHYDGIVGRSKDGTNHLFDLFAGYPTAVNNWTIYMQAGTTTLYGSNHSLNEWYHLAFIYNGSHVALYVNGSMDIEWASIPTFIADTETNITIGRSKMNLYDGDNYGTFVGKIDEFKYFNYSLSSSEIMDHYQNGINNLTRLGSEVTNTLPRITYLDVTPKTLKDNENLNFSVIVEDSENDTLEMCEFFVRNNTVVAYYGNYSIVSNNTNTTIFTVNSTLTADGDLWNFSIRCYDGYAWSSLNYTEITVQNTTLLLEIMLPAANSHVWDRTPVFNISVLNSTCWMSLDGGSNVTIRENMTSYDDDDFWPNPITSGTHNFTVSCERDTNSSASDYETITLYINQLRFPRTDSYCENFSITDVPSSNISYNFSIPDNAYNVSLAFNVSVYTVTNTFTFNSTTEYYIINGSTQLGASGSIVGVVSGNQRRSLVTFNLTKIHNSTATDVSVCTFWTSAVSNLSSPSKINLYRLNTSYNANLNWSSNDSSSFWANSGGDYYPTLLASVEFNASEYQQLCFNISDADVNGWFSENFTRLIFIPENNSYYWYGEMEVGGIEQVNLTGTFTSYPNNLQFNGLFNSTYNGALLGSYVYESSSDLTDNLTGSLSNKTKVINISSETIGGVTVCMLNHSFQLQTFDPAVSLSDGYPFFYFSPSYMSEKNVSALYQNDTNGILNLTNNLTSRMDIYVKINASITSIDLKISNDSSVANATNISTSYFKVHSGLNESESQMFWFWADYYNPASLPRTYDVWFLSWLWD